MKTRSYSLLAIFVPIFFMISGTKKFTSWSQLDNILFSSLPLTDWEIYIHLPRFLVFAMGILLEDNFPDYGFSLYCTIFWVLNAFLWEGILLKLNNRKIPILAWSLFMAAHFFMNGRGIVLWTSWLCCVSLFLDIETTGLSATWKKSRALTALILATASTGVFAVVFFSTVWFSLKHLKDKSAGSWHVNWHIYALMLPFAIMAIAYFLMAINKNLDFFGGGISGFFGILQHGTGRFLFTESYLTTIITSAVAMAGLTFLLWIRQFLTPTLWQFLIIALLGGMFGILVATLALPILLCALSNFMNMRKVARQHPDFHRQ